MNDSQPGVASAEHRRTKVAALLLRHSSEREMAAALGVSKTTVHNDITQIRAEWLKLRQADAEQWRAEELARLAALERGIWHTAVSGDTDAIGVVLRLMDRRARLLGLDAPTRIAWASVVDDAAAQFAQASGLEKAEVVALAQAWLAETH